MRLLLTGFMGVGKTTVGRLLAKRLDLSFFDLDLVVEEDAGVSVAEIFETQGEAEFRRLERSSLAALLERERVVIATGGGTMVAADSFEQLPDGVVTIWLDAELDVIESRLESIDRMARPLYQSPAQVQSLYVDRLPAYRRADHRVVVGGRDSGTDVVDRIVEALEEASCATS